MSQQNGGTGTGTGTGAYGYSGAQKGQMYGNTRVAGGGDDGDYAARAPHSLGSLTSALESSRQQSHSHSHGRYGGGGGARRTPVHGVSVAEKEQLLRAFYAARDETKVGLRVLHAA